MATSGAVLGAALGAGLALFVALTLILYHYYTLRRRQKSWGDDFSRFPPHTRPEPQMKGRLAASEGGFASPPRPLKYPPYPHPHASQSSFGKIQRTDSRGSRTSTKSCPPCYICPQQEFNVYQEQRIVQPIELASSLPEVRGILEEGMLTHQSHSLPPSVHPLPGTRLNRTPSISSQGSQVDYTARKGHRGSSPAIRTFTPEGISTGSSPPESPPIMYQGSRSPSPITNIRSSPTSSISELNGKQQQSCPSPMGSFRRGSRCLSPLLIPPKSPTPSDGSGGASGAAAPLSPLLGSLQLDLYQTRDVKIHLPGVKQPESGEGGSLGVLHFSLKYDFDKSDLEVHIVEAQNLTCSNLGGFNDPYIRVFLSPQVDSRKRQTAIHRNEQNPFFNETFKFPVGQDELKEKILILQIFDYDRYSRYDVVGQVSFRLDEFDVTTNLEIWADVTKNKKPSGERQEILVSLSYLPSAERLTVVLLKARNLYSPPNKETLDPFVKVYLLGGGKRLKKKKTTARKNTQSPVWNEAVAFSISASSLANASLEICVLDQSNDLMGSNALIGSCVLGRREQGSELLHWQDMSQNFRKSVAMWHVLT